MNNFLTKVYEIRDQLSKRFLTLEKGYLNTIVVVTGQACSLKCKNCGNFTPYHSKNIAFYDADKIIMDISKLTKAFKGIKLCQFQGGEFFLHRDADKILEAAIKNPRIWKIYIATNGIFPTIKPHMLQLLMNKKVSLRISNYGKVNERKRKELYYTLKKNNINVWQYEFSNGRTLWSDLGGIDMSRRDEVITQKTFQTCDFKGCLT